MRPLSWLCAAASAAAWLSIASLAGAEEIQRFDVDVVVSRDDRFEVTERIRYDFGSERRHGIFREIPVEYGRGLAADYRIDVEIESVTDADGVPHPYRSSRAGKNLRVQIGDANAFRTGVVDYWLRYTVERGVLYFDEQDEIYWNATGGERSVPVRASSVAVTLPEGTALEGVQYACFTGPQGSVESACSARAEPGRVAFQSMRSLGPREGLTFVVGLPKGVLNEPTWLERFLSRFGDYLSFWSLLPFVALAEMNRRWRKEGRDPTGRGAIPTRYEPPDGMTPAEVGVVIDESVDMVDITSSIIELAVQGYLRIEETESTKFLFLSEKDYALEKLREPEGLPPLERVLMQRLFERGPRITVSSLKNEFYRHLPELREALYQEVSRDGRYFARSPDKVRRGWYTLGGVLAALGAAAFFFMRAPHVAIPIAVSGVVVLGFARFMPRRTKEGRRAYEEILGFREFVARVDAGRLERMGGRSADQFERVLPFAVVLGVADAWADAFDGIYTEPPGWYTSSRGGPFHPRIFVGDIGRSMETIGHTMASTPQKGGGSGSSGFGGGGFSGGGFGGGSTGSW